MRTNTITFRRNAFKTMRAQGVSSAKTRQIVEMLAFRLRYHTEFPAGTEILVSMDEADAQRVCLVKDGLVLTCLNWEELRHLQPLVDTTPTVRQLELCEQMNAIVSGIYTAMHEGDLAYEAEHGAPHTEADYEAQRLFVQGYAPYRAVMDAYGAAKRESLAINPLVAAHLVDPDRASFWYEWHREAYNYRPLGFRTLAMIEREMETMPRFIQDEAA